MKTETPITEFTQISESRFRLNSRVFGRFTFEELEDLELIVKKLRKGVKRLEDFPPIQVFIDESVHDFKTLPSLRKFLLDCEVDTLRFEVFRNMGKGVTVHFNKVHKQ